MRLLISCLSIVFILFISAPVQAQQYTIETTCGQLARYAADSNAEYKPGVDADGNAVAPADLNHVIRSDIYPIEIPVEIKALKLMDLKIDPKLEAAIDSQTKVAHMMVYEDGSVEYNGEDISDRVSHRCLDSEEESAAKPDRQSAKDVVPSGPEKMPTEE